jgi:integrase
VPGVARLARRPLRRPAARAESPGTGARCAAGGDLPDPRHQPAALGQPARFAEPKTPRSRRTIPLPATLTAKLRAHRIASKFKGPDALVFPNLEGGPLDAHNLARRHFKAVAKAAGLPPTIRLYDLRHSTATLLLTAGENAKVVAERLGHASIRLTLDTYSHVLPTMQEAAAAKLDAMLFGGVR